MKLLLFFLPFVLLLLKMPGPGTPAVYAAAYPYRVMQGEGYEKELMPVIGFIDTHRVEDGETLHAIARNFGLGYNQIVLYHPDKDPWLPEKGREIDIPTKWILPPSRHREVVVNIPEMRIYRFFGEKNMVKTYPIGIGREGFDTPAIEGRVAEKIKHPSWTVPSSAWDEYGRGVMPPGPENPLGDYWVGLSVRQIGIHGTNFPWGVGRRVSRGCIRMYPEDIEQFYAETQVGTTVEIIYEPVKVGVRGDLVFMEVHPDVYARIPDLESRGWEILKALGLEDAADPQKVRRCIEDKKGVPIRISVK